MAALIDPRAVKEYAGMLVGILGDLHDVSVAATGAAALEEVLVIHGEAEALALALALCAGCS